MNCTASFRRGSRGGTGVHISMFTLPEITVPLTATGMLLMVTAVIKIELRSPPTDLNPYCVKTLPSYSEFMSLPDMTLTEFLKAVWFQMRSNWGLVMRFPE